MSNKLGKVENMIAWSEYFKSYIKAIDLKSDTDWTFVICNKKGRTYFWNRKPLRARSKFSDFKWMKI